MDLSALLRKHLLIMHCVKRHDNSSEHRNFSKWQPRTEILLSANKFEFVALISWNFKKRNFYFSNLDKDL